MNKKEYLNKPVVNDFIQYFSQLISNPGAKLIQSYKPSNSKQRFEIQHFSDALQQYHWNKKDYHHTTIELSQHCDRIQKALTNEDEFEALTSSIRIFEWGGVINRASVTWLVENAERRQLVAAIKESIDILTSDSDEQVHRFNDNKALRSDSATTKLFSLASKEKSIIYDNRVGAALGVIIKAYLKSAGLDKVPTELNFMRGDATKRDQKRNPSEGDYQFDVKKTGAPHALCNLRANWIIEQVVQNWECPVSVSINSPLREIEAILFMIGYDITTVEKISLT